MTPIHELLSRIRWDRQFGQGHFVIGYYDRVEDSVLRVALRELLFQPDNHFAFDLIDRDGVLHTIPLHRIREVYKDGKLIWQRVH
jgi:uncharacterized protein (UPF0248 family)